MESKNVLITGATSGIGLAFAKVFAANGYNLVLVARHQAQLEQVARELQKQHKIFVKWFSAKLARGLEERPIEP